MTIDLNSISYKINLSALAFFVLSVLRCLHRNKQRDELAKLIRTPVSPERRGGAL